MSPDPQANAFLRGILRQPDDTTARLVFADWLDERGGTGDEAWARYLRAQVEAAKHPAGASGRLELERVASAAAFRIGARLTVPAALIVRYPRSLLQLLPPPNLVVSLAEFDIPRDVVELMPESVARESRVLPLTIQGRTLLVATSDANNELIQKLDFILNKDTIAVGCDDADLGDAINRHYGEYETESVESILVEFTDSTCGPTRTATGFECFDPAAPVSRMVAFILGDTIERMADAAELVPESDSVVLRYRLGGSWVPRDRMPLRLVSAVADRIAYLCGVWPRRPLAAPFTQRFPFTHRGFTLSIGATLTPGEFGTTITFDIPDLYVLPHVADAP